MFETKSTMCSFILNNYNFAYLSYAFSWFCCFFM